MTDETKDITKMPYASWLEQALHDISEYPLQGIVLAGIRENGDVYTNYYELSMAAKVLIAGIINQDAMLDTLINSGYIEDDDEEDEEDDVEE
jgi:hypothetical protein